MKIDPRQHGWMTAPETRKLMAALVEGLAARWGGGGVLALALMFGLPGIRRRPALLIGLCALIVAGVIGCGGGGAPSSNVQPGTPATTAGSYTFSVTATDASKTKTIASINVTVIVQ